MRISIELFPLAKGSVAEDINFLRFFGMSLNYCKALSVALCNLTLKTKMGIYCTLPKKDSH